MAKSSKHSEDTYIPPVTKLDFPPLGDAPAPKQPEEAAPLIVVLKEVIKKKEEEEKGSTGK